MSAGRYNITIEQGATFSKSLVLKDDQQVPVDLTNVTEARAQVREKNASDTKWDFTVTITNAAAGEVSWTMPATTTQTIPFRNGQYDLEIEWTNTNVERLLQGDVTIIQNITR